MHLGVHGTLATDGRDGHGTLRGVHRVHSITQLEGIHYTPDRITDLRRLLGFLFLVHIQHKCNG